MSDITTRILTEGADDDFRLRAFKDYAKAKTEAYQQYMVAMSRIVEQAPDTDINDVETAESVSEQLALDTFNEVLAPLGFLTTDKISYNDGYISVIDTLKLCSRDVVFDMNALSDSVPEASLTDAAGTITVAKTMEDLIEETKSNLHSSVCLQAACEAMDVARDDVAGRISIFNDKVTQIFSNTYSDLSNTAAYLKENLLKANNVQSFVSGLAAILQADDVAEPNTDFTVGQSDFAKFSGASPMNAIASGAAKGLGIVGAAINIGASVVNTVVNSIFNIGKKLFSKAATAVSRVFANPYDVKVINDKANSFTVDGWCVGLDDFSGTGNLLNHNNYVKPAKLDDALANILNDRGKWFKIQDLGCEYLFMLEPDAEFTVNTYIDGPKYSLDADAIKAYAKPRSLNVLVYNEFIDTINTKYSNQLTSYGAIQLTPQQFVDELKLLKAKANLYSSVPSNEYEQYSSFMAGYMLSHLIQYFGVRESCNGLYDNNPDEYIPFRPQHTTWAYDYDNERFKPLPTSGAVSNKDFVKLLTGFEENNGVWSNATEAIGPVNDTTHELFLWKSDMTTNIFNVILLSYLDRVMRPLDFSFFPYRLESEGWSEPTFAIKDDEENGRALELLITIVVVVALTLIVAMPAIMLIKRIGRAITFRRLELQSRLNNKMWTGGQLTDRERKQYLRMTRRLNKHSIIGAGLQDTTKDTQRTVEIATEETNTLVRQLQNCVRK